jgi:hypothetical protein
MVVKLDNKFGFIDQTGQFVIAPQFNYALNFTNGLALVYTEGKAGYINKTGQYIWPPTR